MKYIILIWFLVYTGAAYSGTLSKIEKSEIDPSLLPGYTLDFDQVFKINEGPLSGKAIVFAFVEPGGGENLIPQFILADGKKIVYKMDVPTVLSGWNIVSVDAVAATSAVAGKDGLRILSILTLEPMSGRSSDYWQQGFVFDIDGTGKIENNSELNAKISKLKPRIKTLKGLKKFLEKK